MSIDNYYHTVRNFMKFTKFSCSKGNVKFDIYSLNLNQSNSTDYR